MGIDDITKAIDVSRNVISDVIDRFFPFCGLTQKALDVYISEIEKSDKPKEYKAWEIMRAKKEFKRLKNIKNIIDFTQDYCTEEDINKTSYAENEEWYDHFFDVAGNTSDESIQRIWAHILANEIKEKGTTPRSVISILSEIDSQLAKSFSLLCQQRLIIVALDENDFLLHGPVINEVVHFDNADDYYRKKGLDLLTLNELEAIGLISSNSFGYIKGIPSAKKILISDGIFTDCIVLKDQTIPHGDIMLTRAGSYLLKIIKPGYAIDQHEIMEKYYSSHGLQFEATNRKIIVVDDSHIRVTN